MARNISPELGGSFPVPCVQELVKESPEIIPPSYLRDDIEPTAPAQNQIPVISMANLLKGDKEELKKLDTASKEWGFFQKKKFWQEPGDLQGFGHAFVHSEEQKLDWSDMFYVITSPSCLRKSNLFPNLPLPFRETVGIYAEELRNLALTIIDNLAKALGIEQEHVRGLFEEGMQSMRMNYYPPCPQPDKVIGLNPHSDATGLTILLQLNEMEGLQIKKDGMWVPVKPLPDAFIVNIGDIMEIVSNGIYSSVEHRAVVNSGKDRLSIATFLNPRLDAELGPAPSLITPQNPPKFRKVILADYLKVDQVSKLHIMEKNISPKLGNSLPVPCVQELAKESPEIIPPRYVREDLEPPAPAVKEIPVINLANLLKGDNEELKKMDIASKEWGFFQLINHGVSSSLVEKVKTDTKDFFHLPMEEKKKFWQEPGDLQGFGHAFVISEEQKLDWSDMFYIMTLPTYLRKSDLFPNLPLPFRETVEMYAEELRNLAMKIIEYLAKALGIEREHIRGLFEGGMQAMRMNHYPRCPQPDKVIGLCPHSDAVGLTILLQLNEKEGLQIRKNGMWIPVKPLPDAFVVNIGDILEILSNGIYRSIEHRAVVNSEEERLSIATFFNPRLDAELGPAPTLITPQNPAQFRTVGKDLGLDSLDNVEIVMALEEEFKPEIPDKEAGVYF
nr:protein SRG1-like [Ipomoea batatas]